MGRVDYRYEAVYPVDGLLNRRQHWKRAFLVVIERRPVVAAFNFGGWPWRTLACGEKSDAYAPYLRKVEFFSLDN